MPDRRLHVLAADRGVQRLGLFPDLGAQLTVIALSLPDAGYLPVGCTMGYMPVMCVPEAF